MSMAQFRWSTTAHARQRNLLERSMLSDGRPQAFFLYGLPHVGKRRIAADLAAALLCTDADTKPCGTCRDCRSSDLRPDLVVLRSSNAEIGVEAVRSFMRLLRTTPVSHSKIGMIEDASNMSVVAANALLKLLEEPPQSSVLILIADTLQSIPATILSRCQLIKFTRLSRSEMEAVIAPSTSAATFSDAFRIAQGRLSKAEELLSDSYASYRENIRNALAFFNASPLQRLLAVSDMQQQAAETSAEAPYAATTASTGLLLDYFESIARDVLLTHSSPKLRIHTSYTAEVDKLAQRYSIDKLSAILRSIGDLRYTIGRNANSKMGLEYLALTQL